MIAGPEISVRPRRQVPRNRLSTPPLHFAQTQLDSPNDYVVYAMMGPRSGDGMPAAAQSSRPGVVGHGGEGEISSLMASRPGLAHPERSSTQSGADQNRPELPAVIRAQRVQQRRAQRWRT